MSYRHIDIKTSLSTRTQGKKTCSKQRIFILAVSLVILLSTAVVSAFDWPQEITSLKQLRHFFAENRRTFISSSVVFPKGDVVKLSEGGRVLYRFEEDAPSHLFPSTLGNAVVIAHENDLRSVYANLAPIALDESVEYVRAADEVALSGNSGWGDENAGLEFSVIDVKNKMLVNPLLVLPMSYSALSFDVGKVFVQDVKGAFTEVRSGRYVEEGVYTFYREVSDTIPPFKTIVSLNGQTVETMTYDALSLWKEKLVLKSATGVNLSFAELYPRDNRQFLCIVHLPRGKNTVIVQVFDIMGNKKQVQYTIDVY